MTWLPTIATTTLDEEGVLAAFAGGVRLALYGVEGAYYATSILCTHGNASLAGGYLEDHSIECPLHQGKFDVRTGAATGPPCTVPLRTFPTSVRDGIVFVEIDEQAITY
jgi:naphthalene 1,2-dioxygenase system ferredoxin subunit